jgi:formylglycine-generating enzyme required for sulfatase activity
VWWNVRAVEAEMKFVPIPAGCFEMGSPDSDAERIADEEPVHHVCLHAFDLGQFEVTQGEWRKVMVYLNPDPSQFNGDDFRPVETVSFNDVQIFIALMNFFGTRHYRLPSESEWEYAARAGTVTPRYWGTRINDGCSYENMADVTLKKQSPDLSAASCEDGFANTAQVGSFKSNPWKLYDILGNVAEWVADCYEGSYRDAPKDNSAFETRNCSTRVVRGGSWSSVARYIRAARRYGVAPYVRSGDFGFRLARDAPR